VRGSNLLSGGNAIEVSLGDRAEPLAAVRLLADREAIDDGFGLTPDIAIACRGAFIAAADSQWPRKWPRSWLVGDSRPQWMPSGFPGSDQRRASCL